MLKQLQSFQPFKKLILEDWVNKGLELQSKAFLNAQFDDAIDDKGKEKIRIAMIAIETFNRYLKNIENGGNIASVYFKNEANIKAQEAK